MVREVEGLNLGRTNTNGLKLTEENLPPFYDIKNCIDILVFSDKKEETVGPASCGARGSRRQFPTHEITVWRISFPGVGWVVAVLPLIHEPLARAIWVAVPQVKTINLIELN